MIQIIGNQILIPVKTVSASGDEFEHDIDIQDSTYLQRLEAYKKLSKGQIVILMETLVKFKIQKEEIKA